jgi:hypothetical protein
MIHDLKKMEWMKSGGQAVITDNMVCRKGDSGLECVTLV